MACSTTHLLFCMRMSLTPLYLWLLALNVMCAIPFTFGPLTFACLLSSVAILHNTMTSTATIKLPSKHLTLLAYACGIWTIVSIALGVFYQPAFLQAMGGIIDIGANTYAATDAFAQGLDPYITKSQLWVTQFPADTPHLTTIDGEVRMFGVPYYYGFPYFPLMFISYLPAYLGISGYLAIRITHIVLILINIMAFKLIIGQLLPQPIRRTALFIAFCSYLGVLRFSIEAVMLGVTDILISSYLLWAFVALSKRQYFIGGGLLGCAQACKLLPAPFVLLAVMWMLYQQKQTLRVYINLLGGYIIANIIFVLPFIIWHFDGFLSSTILYYLTHHQGGDTTSLWYFLPSIAQTPFLLIGLLLTLSSIIYCQKSTQYALTACLSAAFSSYVLFMIFSKMTHLNYLWGVFPLGCLALALTLTQSLQLKSQD